jgi:hypothetical protein
VALVLQLSHRVTHPNQPLLFSPIADQPRYVRGHAVTLSMVALGTIIYGFMWFWYQRLNKLRDAGEVDEKYRGLEDDELKELGDDSPHFRYTI